MSTSTATDYNRRDWRARGLCATDPDLFFSSDPGDIARAQGDLRELPCPRRMRQLC